MTKYLMLAILVFSLCGCAMGLIVSPLKSSKIDDVIRFKSAHPEFVNVLVKIGDEDGYEVRKSADGTGILDSSMNQQITVNLTHGMGNGDTFIANTIGKVKIAYLTFETKNNGKTWNCLITVAGNFDDNKEDAALRFWSEFKPKLLQRLQKASLDGQLDLQLEKEPEQEPLKVVDAPKTELKPKAIPPTNKKILRNGNLEMEVYN